MRISFLLLAVVWTMATNAQLSGTYTVVPGGGGNYITLTAAVNALAVSGVSGPVTISIANGVYNEELVIPAIAGTSAVNTVTFTSTAGSASAVTIAPLTSSIANGDMAISLDGTDHTRFTYLTIDPFRGGLGWRGEVNGLLVDHCVFLGDGAGYSTAMASSGDLQLLADASITNCSFAQFRSCISVLPTAGGSVIRLVVRGNTITSTATNADGINCGLSEDVVIENNVIDLQAPIPVDPYYSQAISVSNSTCPIRIAGNNVVHGTGGGGIEVSNCTGSPTAMVVLENNMVRLTAAYPVASAVLLTANSHVRCVHNTMRSDIDRSALSITYVTETTLVGNIISTVSSTVAYIVGETVLSSESNLFHGPGITVVKTYDFVLLVDVYHDLASWQAQGYDLSSRFADPLFISATDLHITAVSPAIGLAPYPALVATDIDNNVRPGSANNLVEAGADELNVCLPLSGTYTIGTTGPARFASFNAAKDALYYCGISGPVVFEVADGTYTETLNWTSEISGTSTVNTVTFRGQSKDSTDVTLTWPSDINVRLITLNGTDHIAFEHMTFQRGTTSGTELVRVENSGAPASFNCAFRNVRFMGISVSNTNNILVRCTTGDSQAGTIFERCAFRNGYEAIKWTGVQFEYLRIADCTFDFWILDAVQVTGMGTGLEIHGNRFTSQLASPGTGLKIFSGSGAFQVERNRFVMSGTGTGSGTIIQLDNCVSGSSQRGRVVNNMLIAWDRAGVNGIQITNACTRIDILHNSVSVNNTSLSGAALVIATSATGSGCEISNNIFHARTSYAVHNTAAIALGTLRRNLLHTTHTSLAHWGGVRSNLAALQTASGQFNNSIQAPPLFVDNANNLHITTTSPAVAAGFVFTTVFNDYDLRSRPLPVATNPDIGADEISQSVPFAPRSMMADTRTESDEELQVFPNPACDQVRITGLPPNADGLLVMDAIGRVMWSNGAQDTVLDISAYPNGTYLVIATSEGTRLSISRLIVAH